MTTPLTKNKAISSLDIRTQLIEALHLDLVGPAVGDALVDEQLPETLRPATWYLTGFLIPSGTPAEQASDPDEDDEAETVPTQTGIDHEANDDRRAAKKGFFPSSLGLTFLVPAEAQHLTLTRRWRDGWRRGGGRWTRRVITDATGRRWRRRTRCIPMTHSSVACIHGIGSMPS